MEPSASYVSVFGRPGSDKSSDRERLAKLFNAPYNHWTGESHKFKMHEEKSRLGENWVVAANGYSQIYDSDFIMKCFGNNFLEGCLYTLLECIALNSPQRTLVWELDCRKILFCLV